MPLFSNSRDYALDALSGRNPYADVSGVTTYTRYRLSLNFRDLEVLSVVTGILPWVYVLRGSVCIGASPDENALR
jgi:hypothetical protein